MYNTYNEKRRGYSEAEAGWLGVPERARKPSPFVHPERSGRVTVKHPSKEIPIGTLCNIYRQVNWKWEDR